MQRATRWGCVAWVVASLCAGCSAMSEDARLGNDPGEGQAGFGGFGALLDGSVPAHNGDRSVVECNASTDVASCGGQSCAPADPFAAQSCQQTCCTLDDLCGLRANDQSECVAQPERGGCPEVTLDLGLGTETLSGCCTQSGTCGAVAFGTCVARVQLELDAEACAPPDAGVDDAGVDDAGSAP